MNWLQVAYAAKLVRFGLMRQGNCWRLSVEHDLKQSVPAESRATFSVNKNGVAPSAGNDRCGRKR